MKAVLLLGLIGLASCSSYTCTIKNENQIKHDFAQELLLNDHLKWTDQQLMFLDSVTYHTTFKK